MRHVLLAALLTACAAPGSAQDLVGFDATDFGQVVLTRKQAFGGARPEVALGAYNNEPIVTYSAKSVFARMGRAVGRLDILTDSGVFPCTAFVVDKATLLTNHHCVPGILDNPGAKSTRIEAIQFVAGYTRQGVDEGTRRFFVSAEPLESSRDLDYSVLRVIGDPSEDFGTLDLVAHDPGDGDPFWIIGHPMGEAQRISRETCRANAPALSDNRLLHTCDTLPGNSGSPVIDASLQAVVALHHAGSDRDAVNFAVPMRLILQNSSVLKAAAAAGPVAAPRPTPAPGPDVSALLEEVAAMGFKLGKEREAREAVQGELTRLQEALEAARKDGSETDALRAETTRLMTLLEETRGREKAREIAVAGLRNALVAAETRAAAAANKARDLQEKLDAAPTGDVAVMQERLARALAAKSEIESTAEQLRARLEEHETLLNEGERKILVLNAQVAALRRQLSQLQTLLDEAQAEESVSRVRLENLGSELNAALARVAVEERRRRILEEERVRQLEEQKQSLDSYRADFMNQLRRLLADRPGISIQGDRFVFSSEVLFQVGSADLSAEGRREIGTFADVLRGIAADIPEEFDWIIRVDGHTDNQQIRPGGTYADNWELSQARALSVVRYLIDSQGIPPDRLSANGFGEFQPVDARDTPEARASNRRIELKLTER